MPRICRDIYRFRTIISSLPSLATKTNTYTTLVRVTFHLSVLHLSVWHIKPFCYHSI